VGNFVQANEDRYLLRCTLRRFPPSIQTDPDHRYVLREVSEDHRTVRICVRSDNLVGDKKALSTSERLPNLRERLLRRAPKAEIKPRLKLENPEEAQNSKQWKRDPKRATGSHSDSPQQQAVVRTQQTGKFRQTSLRTLCIYVSGSTQCPRASPPT